MTNVEMNVSMIFISPFTKPDGIVRCKEDICKKCFSKMYEALQKKPNHDGMKEVENDEV